MVRTYHVGQALILEDNGKDACMAFFEKEHINARYTDGQQSQDRTK
jgi:hypothetical protein